jgi:hypothetical protein
LSSVTNSVRNAMVYGTLCKLNGAYEKLRKNEVQEQDRSLRFNSAYYVSNIQCCEFAPTALIRFGLIDEAQNGSLRCPQKPPLTPP